MSITVNTNMAALRIQGNLSNATDKMNTAMERMSSGYKINKAADDAAGYAVSTKLKKTLSGTDVAEDNVAIGTDLLSTVEGVLDVVRENLLRIHDLVEQASNGTYATDDLEAIQAEIDARLEQITSLTTNASFNGKDLFVGSGTAITIQSGTTQAEQTRLDASIFAQVSVSTLTTNIDAAFTTGTSTAISAMLDDVSGVLDNIVGRETSIGAAQNKLDAVADSLKVQKTNLTSALSTVQDADVAEESAAYVASQILQSASSTLLVQANSAPQIALTLIQGQ